MQVYHFVTYGCLYAIGRNVVARLSWLEELRESQQAWENPTQKGESVASRSVSIMCIYYDLYIVLRLCALFPRAVGSVMRTLTWCHSTVSTLGKQTVMGLTKFIYRSNARTSTWNPWRKHRSRTGRTTLISKSKWVTRSASDCSSSDVWSLVPSTKTCGLR